MTPGALEFESTGAAILLTMGEEVPALQPGGQGQLLAGESNFFCVCLDGETGF